MYSKVTLIALGMLLINACVNGQQLGGRRSQDRLNLVRQYDDGSRGTARHYDDLYDRQHQEQDLHDRRGDNGSEDYSYGYAVRDELSGDIKSQQEVRNGDRVRGQYRTLESDGTERIVDYTADDYRGFNAVVRHQPPVGTRAQLVQTLQPAAVLLRTAHVGQLGSGGLHRQPAATVLLHH